MLARCAGVPKPLVQRFLVALIFVALSCATSGPAERSGARATEFSLRDIDGKTVRLSDYRGSVVVVNFWATWCTPCHAEMPHLDRLYKQYRDQGFVVLSIAMDGPETIAGVAPTVRRLALSYPVLLDEETRVVASYNPRREAPFTLIIDRNGAIVWTKVGYSSGDEIALEKQIQANLAAPPQQS
jgi:peroxiredoxin